MARGHHGRNLPRSSIISFCGNSFPAKIPSELTDRTPLITGGILDSISTLKLVVFLEEHFGIRVEAYEAGVEHLDSIGQIAALVARRKRAAA